MPDARRVHLPVPCPPSVRRRATLLVGVVLLAAVVALPGPGAAQQLPVHPSGGIRFGPATVVDAQRTYGEPLNFIDKDGNILLTGPVGTHTSQGLLHRSTDGGDQFNVVSPVSLRPNPPPGGGDTDVVVDDQGVMYFTDLEALVDIDVSVSNDDGHTWRKNPLGVTPGDDRQWFAVDNGITPAAEDNTIFIGVRQVGQGLRVFSSPGSRGPTDPIGGLVYQNAADQVTGLAPEASCGQVRFDHVKRNFYYPCNAGSRVRLTVGHVEPGQRTGIHFVNVLAPPTPPGPPGSIFLFPGVGTDRAGNVYVVWAESGHRAIWYSYAAPPDDIAQPWQWSDPVRLNGAPANTAVMPWIQGGAPGTFVVSFYGTDAAQNPNSMPSWFNDRQAADDYKWFGYVSLVESADTGSPSIFQAPFTEKPMHYGQICTAGLACQLTGGDRVLLEYNAVFLDRRGVMRIIYNDTTSQHHAPHLFETAQIAGRSAFGQLLRGQEPGPAVSDPTGDAAYPHYAPTGEGPNLRHLDFTGLRARDLPGGILRVEATFDDLSAFAPAPPGKTRSLWVVRFNARSLGEGGEESYRIFYVGAESSGGSPAFFAGSGTSNTGPNQIVPGNGCINTLPGNVGGCKFVVYPAEAPANGRIQGNRMVIDVPLDGFGAGRPILGNRLFSMTGVTMGRNATQDIYADVDSTRPFDLRLRRLG